MKTIEGFKLRRMGSEYIVVGEGLGQIDFNRLISLNHSAAYLWDQIKGMDFTTESLASLLVERYGIDLPTALNDAKDIVTDWLEAEIIE